MRFFHSLVLGVLLVALTTSATFARAAGDGTSGADHAQKKWQRMVDRLHLTPDQQTRLQPIVTAHQERLKAQREQTKAQMTAVLTPEQRARFEQLMAERKSRRQAQGQGSGTAAGTEGRGRDSKGKGLLRSLNLTDTQKTQLKQMRQESKAARNAEQQQFVAQVEAILTPEQRAQFEQMRAHRRDGGNTERPQERETP